MCKRFLTLILAVMLAMSVMIPAALAEDDTPSASAGYYYVYTENGKTLNVRATPGGDVVGHLKYGTQIYCYYKDNGNGWALIDYKYNMPGVGEGTYACFVSSRFLVKNKPAARTSSASKTSASGAAAVSTDPLMAINEEFRAAKKVTPYTVYARPSRASSWVNLRWAPTKTAEIMATYKANAPLTVIQELKNWFQVEDPDTGLVGFVDKSFVLQ